MAGECSRLQSIVNNSIASCWSTARPQLNRAISDIYNLICVAASDTCIKEVPPETPPSNFVTLGWSGVPPAPEECPLLYIIRGTEAFIAVNTGLVTGDSWCQLCASSACSMVLPASTPPAQFVALGWGGTGNLPDQSQCPVLFVMEGCNVWIAPNDPDNCDLTTGGTAWVKVTAGGISAMVFDDIPTSQTDQGVVINWLSGKGTTDSTHINQVNLADALSAVNGDHSTIAGGTANEIAGDRAFIGAGNDNQANGDDAAVVTGSGGNRANGAASFVGGGDTNTIAGTNGAIVGGQNNSVNITNGFIGGGQFNQIAGLRGGIVAGLSNAIGSTDAFIGGGNTNVAGGQRSGVVAGNDNQANGNNSIVGGGDDNQVNGVNSIIGGGNSNVINNDADNAFIGGGTSNLIFNSVSAAAVVAGNDNSAGGENSFVGAGTLNVTDGENSAVVAGQSNIASGTNSGVLAGQDNAASGLNALALGQNNTVFGDTSVAIGRNNTIELGVENSIAIGTSIFIPSTESNAVIIGGGVDTLAFFNGTPVTQRAAIPDATGGSNIDTEARAAINALLQHLRDYNLIAT